MNVDAGLEAFADHVMAQRDRPVRCHEVLAALGEDASVARHVERAGVAASDGEEP